jgi:hypothetical protein
MEDLRSFLDQQQECPRGCAGVVELQQEGAAGAGAVPAYSAGAASNFVSQPREQKWYVLSLYVDEPTALAGLIVIPQTGSVTVTEDVVEWFMEISFHRS